MAGESTVVLTADGKQELEQELRHLRTVRRPTIERRIHELTLDGDVSDNSEYEDTKEALVLIDARIREIEHTLRRARVVEHDSSSGVVGFGSHVTIVDGEGTTETWTLVGPEEANTLHRKISTSSPVGAALLGKRVGDTLVVRAPGGETEYKIVKID